jgi:predicted KAP-like P-loop ATPase
MPDLAFASDQPIEHMSDDRLGRRPFAEAIAHQVATAPASDGFAVGLVGPWGSGKTSILNMMRENLGAHQDSVIVVNFNPWLFSGTEQLMLAFFRELVAVLSSQANPTRS